MMCGVESAYADGTGVKGLRMTRGLKWRSLVMVLLLAVCVDARKVVAGDDGVSGESPQVGEIGASRPSGPGILAATALVTRTLSGHTYTLYEQIGGIRWADAQAFAVSVGGYLATINSAQENELLASMLDDAIAAGHPCYLGTAWVNTWFGLSNTTGSFVWVTGEAVSDTNGASGEPNEGTPAYGMRF